jgi:hypothetical protein
MASIKGVSIIVAGTVSGDLSASQRIELQTSAKVSGNLTAPKLVVQRVPCSRGIAPRGRKQHARIASSPLLRKVHRGARDGQDSA